MRNFLNITKIYLLSFFEIYKVFHATTKEEKKKATIKLLIILFSFGAMSSLIYYYAREMISGFITLDIPYIFLTQFMVMVSLFTVFSNIYKINGTLFDFKDYDLLLSLPIKRSTVIISKLTSLYLGNLIYTILFMVPCYIIYLHNVAVANIFHLYYWLSILIIPLAPMIVSTIIGTILTAVASNFKYKKVVNMLLTFALVFGIMYYSAEIDMISVTDLAKLGESFVEFFNQIYPLTKYYVEIIRDNSFEALLIFSLIPIIIFVIYTLIVVRIFRSVNGKINSYYKKNNFKLQSSKKRSAIGTLYIKELKRYFSSIIYVTNTAIGPLFLTIGTFVFVFMSGDKLETMMGIEGLADMVALNTPIIIACAGALSCTTHASISLEGKNLWILKSLPVKTKEIFISKILVNLTITVPFILLNGILLAGYLGITGVSLFYLFLIPLLSIIFVSQLGLFLNLLFPDLDWKSEVKPIKQSLSVIITMVVSIVIFACYFFFDFLNFLNYTIILLIINIILYVCLTTIGKTKLRRL